MDSDKRNFLQYLGLTGLLGLAGCQDTPSQTATHTSPSETTTATKTSTTTETPSPTDSTPTTEPGVTLDVKVKTSEASKTLLVTGEITGKSDIVEVKITVGETTQSLAIENDRHILFEQTFQIEGGQSYEVEVIAKTNADKELFAQTSTGYVPMPANGLSTNRLVGAHYYPWYEMHNGHENWTDTCIEVPKLGEYAANDSGVIDQHLTWCLDHGIRWLSVSWWGKGSGADQALSNAVMEAEKFDQLNFSILYETPRLEEFDFNLDNDQARKRLREDLQYLEAEYFSEDNYLLLDGRPVVFFYIANAFSGDIEAAFTEINQTLETDIYVLADVPFGQSLGTAPISAVADGITSYNPYSPREDIEDVFHDLYAQGNRTMNLSAKAADTDFVPVVIPGFNDTALPDSQRPDHPILSASPTRYERVCKQVRPHLADSKAVLITSFNEWYENTQIEPSEQFGKAYLETTANQLATGSSSGFDPLGKSFSLTFNNTIIPAKVNKESTDTRKLAFMADELTFYAGDERLTAFDFGVVEEEPIFLQGVFGIGSHDGRNWRWLGGPTAEATMFIEDNLTGADQAVLTGQPMRSNDISATVFFDGTQTDTIDFGRRTIQSYTIDLSP